MCICVYFYVYVWKFPSLNIPLCLFRTHIMMLLISWVDFLSLFSLRLSSILIFLCFLGKIINFKLLCRILILEDTLRFLRAQSKSLSFCFIAGFFVCFMDFLNYLWSHQCEDCERLCSSFALVAFQFSSVAQLCHTLCHPMGCSMLCLAAHHHLPEFTQTLVHWIGYAIQPSHSLSSPSPPTFNLS